MHISTKKILLSISTIGVAAAVVIGGTGAVFNDLEVSEGNIFTAGSINLKVDSESHYNGMFCLGTSWVKPEECTGEGASMECSATYGDCSGSWSLRDLGAEKFFNYNDIKPGDNGENTISLHVINNDAYVCMYAEDLATGDNQALTSDLKFFIWRDDGDNIYEQGEVAITQGPVTATSALDDEVYPLYTPSSGALEGLSTAYVGMAWCAGEMTIEDYEILCNGEGMGNESQGASLTSTIGFYVEQEKNNPEFVCPEVIPYPQS